MELWDVYDRAGNLTGRTVPRGNCRLKSGEYHLVVHIWVVGSDGRLIIQKRSNSRPMMAGEWAATGGAAVSGEDSLTAAHREFTEEMGIDIPKKEFNFIKRLYRRNSFVDIYTIRRTIPLSRLVLQEEEVAAVRKVHRKQLIQLVKQGKFHNYGKEYFDALMDGISTKSKRHYKRSKVTNYER